METNVIIIRHVINDVTDVSDSCDQSPRFVNISNFITVNPNSILANLIETSTPSADSKTVIVLDGHMDNVIPFRLAPPIFPIGIRTKFGKTRYMIKTNTRHC